MVDIEADMCAQWLPEIQRQLYLPILSEHNHAVALLPVV